MKYAIFTLILAIIAISFIPDEDTLGYNISKQIEERQRLLKDI